MVQGISRCIVILTGFQHEENVGWTYVLRKISPLGRASRMREHRPRLVQIQWSYSAKDGPTVGCVCLDVEAMLVERNARLFLRSLLMWLCVSLPVWGDEWRWSLFIFSSGALNSARSMWSVHGESICVSCSLLHWPEYESSNPTVRLTFRALSNKEGFRKFKNLDKFPLLLGPFPFFLFYRIVSKRALMVVSFRNRNTVRAKLVASKLGGTTFDRRITRFDRTFDRRITRFDRTFDRGITVTNRTFHRRITGKPKIYYDLRASEK
jgi:hypothetical protein